VVAFDDAGAAELIRDGRNGLLVRPGDDAGFIAAVTRLADGSVDAAALRQRARQVALARDWEPLLQSFEHRLQQLAWVSAAGHAPQAAAGELA
jgi:glycosyltransferase involved in cell wall biosynthesis